MYFVVTDDALTRKGSVVLQSCTMSLEASIKIEEGTDIPTQTKEIHVPI